MLLPPSSLTTSWLLGAILAGVRSEPCGGAIDALRHLRFRQCAIDTIARLGGTPAIDRRRNLSR